MLRQIKYFQSVVKNNSFSVAAEECHISQSAISQQIKALENELGFKLLERNNRKFTLTPAGEHFYKKSLVLIADFERLCNESLKISQGNKAELKIGYLRSYIGHELGLALDEFSSKYPQVSLTLLCGNHEELFSLVRNDNADVVLNDQRRAFSDEYENFVLTSSSEYIEISSRNSLSSLSSITTHELKNIPCIIVSSKEQREIEQEYYRTILGIQSEFIFAENIEEAKLLVISGQGYMPVEGRIQHSSIQNCISCIPIYNGNSQITRKYGLFWKKYNSGYYIEEFAQILKSKFV